MCHSPISFTSDVLTKPQLARFVQSSGLDDRGHAEKEVVLTYLLQLLVERGFIERIVFKGGTCIRKMLLGNRGRFSTDLDFTARTEVADPDGEFGASPFRAATYPLLTSTLDSARLYTATSCTRPVR